MANREYRHPNLGTTYMTQRPTIELVYEFHEVFQHHMAMSPRIPNQDILRLRAALLVEEVGEYLRAGGYNHPRIQQMFDSILDFIRRSNEPQTFVDMIEAADALGDIDYVTAGANLAWGFPAYAIINNIHESNMSKIGADGKPHWDAVGKTIKGPNYRAPKLLPILLQFARGETVQHLTSMERQKGLPIDRSIFDSAGS